MRSRMAERSTFSRLSVVSVLLSLAGCGVGQNGIDPPLDRISLPGGLAADPSGDWLYVLNSNGDLRYNAGTLTALDLRKVREDRSAAVASTWPACTKTHFTSNEDVPARACCRDETNDHILNCNDRGYVKSDATVLLGSFGGAMVVQQDPLLSSRRRLYMIVRGDSSITFTDVLVGDTGPQIRCTGDRGADPATAPRNASCDDNWRIQRPSNAEAFADALGDESHSLVLNDALGVLFVGHLAVKVNNEMVGGGVSSIDVCGGPQVKSAPLFRNFSRTAFAGAATQSVTTLSLNGTDANAPLFAIQRTGAEVDQLVLRDPNSGRCDLAAPRTDVANVDLSVVPGEKVFSSVFEPAGNSIRGFVLSPGATAAMEDKPCTGSATDCRQRAYVLHRNDAAADPAALVVLDRTPDQAGRPANLPISTIEVCTGPSSLYMHDAGRGNMLYVTCFEGGQLYIIDPELLSLAAAIDTGRGPNNLIFAPDGQTAYVGAYADNSVAVIDLAPGSPTEFRVVQRIGFPHAVTE